MELFWNGLYFDQRVNVSHPLLPNVSADLFISAVCPEHSPQMLRLGRTEA
mgnify:CR=1